MSNEKKAKRYTAEERKAYYIGVGACIGNRKSISKAMKNMPEHVKKSFMNGFDDQLTKKDKRKY